MSVVIPAYNERDRLPPTLDSIAACLRSRLDTVEVLVVDDGSTDDTLDVASSRAVSLGLRLRTLRHSTNRGKGFAVRRGMLAARGDVVLLCDADESVAMSHLEAFEARLALGHDLVIGSRHLSDSKVSLHQPLLREQLGGVFRALARTFVVKGVSDFTCGFKLFNLAAARRVFSLQRLWGWGYDVELLVIARKLGLRIAEEAVEWRDDGRTRVRLGRDGLRSATDLLRIRFNQLAGRYRPDGELGDALLEDAATPRSLNHGR